TSLRGTWLNRVTNRPYEASDSVRTIVTWSVSRMYNLMLRAAILCSNFRTQSRDLGIDLGMLHIPCQLLPPKIVRRFPVRGFQCLKLALNVRQPLFKLFHGGCHASSLSIRT